MKRVLIALGALVAGMTLAMLTSQGAVAQQAVCPEGNGWTKVEWKDRDSKETYSADNGKTIAEVCVKGGNFIEYFTNNGTKVCWEVDFKNNRTKVEIAEKHCGGNDKPDISHISYKQSEVEPTATPTNTPTVTPSNTPVPTEAPQCKKLNAECELNNSNKECCKGLVCVKSKKGKSWKCEQPDTTPTPSVDVTPSVTPVEEPTPTQPVGGEGRKAGLGYEVTCDKDEVSAKMHFTNDGEPMEGVKTTFDYNGNKKEATSNSNGYAIAVFPKDGENLLVATTDGFDKIQTKVQFPDCPATGGGEVLGATTGSRGQVLGATTYASTGVGADMLMQLSGVLGTLMVSAGALMHAKQK